MFTFVMLNVINSKLIPEQLCHVTVRSVREIMALRTLTVSKRVVHVIMLRLEVSLLGLLHFVQD